MGQLDRAREMSPALPSVQGPPIDGREANMALPCAQKPPEIRGPNSKPVRQRRTGSRPTVEARRFGTSLAVARRS